MANSNREYMVWGEGLPKVRHTSHGKAMAEAHRLSKKHPGQEFVLLEVKKVVVHKPECDQPTQLGDITQPTPSPPLCRFIKRQTEH